MDKQIKFKDALKQVKIGMEDDMQDYVNLDYAGRGLKVIDYAVQNECKNKLLMDEDGDLYCIDGGVHVYA